MCETLRSIGPVQPRSNNKGNGREPARRLSSNNLVKKPKQACSPHERQAKAQGDDCLRPHLNQAGFSGCPRGSVRILGDDSIDAHFQQDLPCSLRCWSKSMEFLVGPRGGRAQSTATSSNTLTPPSCLSSTRSSVALKIQPTLHRLTSLV